MSKDEKKQVSQGINSLEPFKSGMSFEDEMTVLKMIEQHENFDATIAEKKLLKLATLIEEIK